MKLVFLGAPGVGKGTQAELVCRSHSWRHISTGELLREAVKNGTELGRKAKEAMDRGDLVADDIILGLIEETLDGMPDGDGFVLDGFPRTLAQARGLDELLEKRGQSLDRVVLLTADVAELQKRMEGRGRKDDTPETISNRLQVYEEKTAPLIEYYDKQGILTRVHGMGKIEEIHERIESALTE